MISVVLLVCGYAVAVPVLVRVRQVFAGRRTAWFAALEAAMLAIVSGWWLRGRASAVAVNAAGFVALALAWVVTGRRRR